MKPPKAKPAGLDRVLFVRANQELVDKLEEIRNRRSELAPGVVLSTADVVRAILWEAVARERMRRET